MGRERPRPVPQLSAEMILAQVTAARVEVYMQGLAHMQGCATCYAQAVASGRFILA